MDRTNVNVQGANPFGCMGCLVSLLLLGALIAGVFTPWGTFHIDLFPPAVYLDKGNAD